VLLFIWILQCRGVEDSGVTFIVWAWYGMTFVIDAVCLRNDWERIPDLKAWMIVAVALEGFGM
jgi:hypothetical protein